MSIINKDEIDASIDLFHALREVLQQQLGKVIARPAAEGAKGAGTVFDFTPGASYKANG